MYHMEDKNVQRVLFEGYILKASHFEYSDKYFPFNNTTFNIVFEDEKINK